mmetsp:Transcript_29377/g.56395  ORF Transcript_29377/g.56395 Transcript_29377/m.56395 type:complete len:584 (+) Transcript_29377:322-2073(+)|eukprot:CAMPEP_0114252902 /NCGR_PEP_ID=MMETSP0058-20121206/16098_1 /TAXON_ID=36894 /ORGANISM="Pyramimonas parkeae, CCMP726" /LENGTH=583 /DNA_ID=CAMNT_0001366895 /DNA_START=248 /DNA_END=1999 /DNA_ORIENTATION=+
MQTGVKLPPKGAGPPAFEHLPNERVEAFLKYLELDNIPAVRLKMGKSGKSVDYSAPIRNVGRGGPTLNDRNRDSTPISHSTKGVRKHTHEALDQKLKQVFCSYCTGKSSKGDLMGITGLVKVLRECRILDNRFDMNDAGVVFYRILAGSDGGASAGKMNFDQFKEALNSIGEYKFPQEKVEVARLKMVGDVIKFGNQLDADDAVFDALCSEQVLEVFKHHDKQLKTVFAHYATLDLVSADVSSWKAVKQANRSMDINESMMCMLNFEIVPHLVTKREAMDLFRIVNMGPAADDNPDDLCFPEFLEYIGRLAMLVSERVADKLISPWTTIMEMSAIRRYMAACGPEARAVFLTLFENRASEVRSRRVQLDGEARMRAQEKIREEQDKQMESYHRAQLAKARREALDRTSSRWVPDGLSMKLSHADTCGNRGTTRGSKRSVATSKSSRNRDVSSRGYTYLGGSSHDKLRSTNPVALEISPSTLSHFVEMDMDGQAHLNDWKSRMKPPVRGPVMGTMADADQVMPEIDNFEHRLSNLNGNTPLPSKANMNQDLTSRLWTPPPVKLPGISDRRIGSPRTNAMSVYVS